MSRRTRRAPETIGREDADKQVDALKSSQDVRPSMENDENRSSHGGVPDLEIGRETRVMQAPQMEAEPQFRPMTIEKRPDLLVPLEAARGRTWFDRLRATLTKRTEESKTDTGTKVPVGTIVRLSVNAVEPIPFQTQSTPEMFVKVHICDLKTNGLWMNKGGETTPVTQDHTNDTETGPEFPNDFPGGSVDQTECWYIRPMETRQGVRKGMQRVEFGSG